MNKKNKTRKITRSFYIPVLILEEIEEITAPDKRMNVNMAVNEALELWLKLKRG
jgi:hypothetical protein